MRRRGMHIGYYGESQNKRTLERPRLRWVDNINMDLAGIEFDAMDLISLAQDKNHWRALVNIIMNLRVP
jgi:hypothetical protein